MKRNSKSNGTNKSSVRRGIVVQGGILAFAGILCRLIGIARKIPLEHIIGNDGNAYYSTAYEVYSMVLILSSYSLPSAVSKLIAQRQTRGQYKKMQKVFEGSFIFAFIMGGIFSILVFVFSDFIATNIQALPMSAHALRVLAPTIFVVALMAVFRGYFQGLGVMHFTAISQIIEQIIVVVVSLCGASLLFDKGEKYGNLMMNPDFGPAMGAAGATIGCCAGAIAGLIFMLVIYLHNKPAIERRVITDTSKNKDSFIDIMFLILKTALPMIISSALYNFTGILDNSIYNHYMDRVGMSDIKKGLLGQYSGKYKLLINLPIAMATAMCSAIIPSLAASIDTKDYVSARSKMATTIRVTMIISIPSAIGLAIYGKPICNLLFKTDSSIAVIMLLYGSISVVFFAMSTLSNGILQGINKVNIPVINAIIGLIVNVGSIYLFLNVFKMGIHSMVVSNLLFALTITILNHYAIYKTIQYKQELRQTFIIPLISSLIMGGVSFIFYIIVKKLVNYQIGVIVAIIVAIIVYFASLVLLKGVNEYDLSTIPYGNKIYRLLKKTGLYKS